MLIKKLTGKRFARHELVEVTPAGSVNGFIGPNGSGKSGALTLIEFLITGESSDTDVPLSMLVKDCEGNASGTMEFVKNGRTGVIFRQIGSSPKRSLEWDGKVIKAAKEVDATMAEIFGASKKAIANGVFINQGKLEAMLFAKGANRRQMFIQMVELDFCSTRAKILDGKIKRIESTIVDLGPTRDAALAARNTATEVLEARKVEVEAARDWQPELDFIARYDKRQAEIQMISSQISRLTTQQQIARTRFDAELYATNHQSLTELTRNVELVAVELKATTEKITSYQSIRSELTHLDRIESELAVAFKDLQQLEADMKAINPEGISVEQWRERIREVLRPRVTAFEQARVADATIKQLEADISKQHGMLQPPPARSKEDIATLLDELDVTRRRKERQEILLLADDKIRSCFAGKNMEEPQICPDCYLKVYGTKPLSDQDRSEVEADIAREQDAYMKLSYQRNDLIRKWEQWETNMARINGTLDKLKESLESSRNLRNSLVLTGVEADAVQELELAHVTVQNICTTSVSLMRCKQLVKIRIEEKMGFGNAVRNRQRRHEFSDAVMASLAADKQQMEIGLKTLTAQLAKVVSASNEVTNTVRELEEQHRQLAARSETEQMSPELDALLQQMNGGWDATRAEVSALQNKRVELRGAFREAENYYATTNKHLHEIDERIGRDVEKLKLLDDLRRLRGILSDDGLPLAFIKYQFEHLTRLTQQGLNKMNANFAIEIDDSEDLNYKFKRLDIPSKVSLPMQNLSGGQRVRLCLAFLMAVQKRLVNDVGLLVLDEPLVHLDQAGVAEAVDFLKGLNEEFQNTEMQIWIVDHNPAIRAALSSYVEFKN